MEEKPQPTKIDAEETMRDILRYRRDIGYFNANYNTLRERYPDVWVAVLDEKVIGHGRNLDRLCKSLRRRGYDTGKTYVGRTYFREEQPRLVLAAA